MAIYSGRRTPTGEAVVTVDGKPLPPRTDLFNHSPTGFEWGYNGSGPAQLALAILAHYSGNDDLAVKLHQEYKALVIARLDKDRPWDIGEASIGLFIRSVRQREKAEKGPST